jgi:hypothetical protein
MNRPHIFVLIGVALLCASLAAGCGSSQSASTQPGSKDVYSMVVLPVRFTLNAGDTETIAAVVDLSKNNGDPKPITPQPTISYSISDPGVTISPGGVVCAGQWDASYHFCVANATLPAGYVTITAYSPDYGVSGSTQLSVHLRAAGITLNATSTSANAAWPASLQPWPSGLTCISQNHQVQYVAQPVDGNGNPIPNCSLGVTPGCIYDNDYTWTSDNSSAAAVSSFGYVVADNPGVANIYASLNGTVSAPLSFATCPPSSIVLSSSAYTGSTPVPPYTTADLSVPNSPAENYVTAVMTDVNGNPINTTALTFTSSSPLAASFGPSQLLSYPVGGIPTTPETTSVLGIHSPGGFTMTAACTPPSCNPSVADFTSPNGPTKASDVGFGYPVLSNVIAATVNGNAGSKVLVTGQTLADGTTAAHRLLIYDSESMALIQSVALANVPNSLVVAPDGNAAYLGSSGGLVVVNLTSYQASTNTFPIVGGKTNPPDVITGTVLGVSPDSRYVVVSDVANSLVFLIDTTGTQTATRFTLAGITSATFSLDGTEIRLGGTSGVYTFQADTFVLAATNASSNVSSMAWSPDGQTYFASGDQMVNYSTCDDQNPQPLTYPSAVPDGLSVTAVSGVPQLLGLTGSPGSYSWFDYAVNSSSHVDATQSVNVITDLTAGGTGNVCKSTVSVGAPVTTASGLQCAASQVSLSPKLNQAFVTGVDPGCGTAETSLYGYDLAGHSEVKLTISAAVPLSGGILSDGRKLFFGTWDSATQTGELHRVDLATSTGAPGTLTEDATPVDVSVVPSYVAVVPN